VTNKVNGLLGRTLKHSFSVFVHQELGNPDYGLYELEPEQLGSLFKSAHIDLLNVTIPYKKDVMSYCTTLSPEAKAVGSVNTITTSVEGHHGHNTDAYGFQYMAKRAGIDFTDKKVLIFGSGGSSGAVRYVVEQTKAQSITTVSRSGEHNYNNLAKHHDAEILINTTPVGMHPASVGSSIVDLSYFPHCEGVLDLVYNPLRTALIIQAEQRGIPSASGLSMLVAQAKAAEELFLGQRIADEQIERIIGLINAQKENIVLIGMPGSGKSTVGAALAQMTGRELIDLDKRIEKAAGMPIPTIFAEQGEAAFRSIESERAAYYGTMTGKIIVCGGGIIKHERNYAPLHQNGRLYHLTRHPSQLAREGRPLSQNVNLGELYQERLPLYTRFRDAVIDNSGTPKQTAQSIWEEFNAYTRHQRP